MCWRSRSAATHAWRSRPGSASGEADRALLDGIRLAHAEGDGAQGAPRVNAVLQALGQGVGCHRVARLMRLAGLRGLAALSGRIEGFRSARRLRPAPGHRSPAAKERMPA